MTRARHVIVSAGLVLACRWRWWLLFVVIAAVNWAGIAGPSPAWGALCAVWAGVFTAWALGPVILWVRGRHPRQLRDHPEEHL